MPLFFSNNSYSQDCPEGYTQRQILLTGYPGNPYCEYYITYCCKWDEETKTLDVKILYIDQRSSCVVSRQYWETFRAWLNCFVKVDALDNCAPALPPCNGEIPIFVNIINPGCYYWLNFYWDKYPNEAEWMVGLRKCPGEYNWCKEVWKLCKDYSIGEIVILEHYCETHISGNCPYDEPTIPPEGYGWE